MDLSANRFIRLNQGLWIVIVLVFMLFVYTLVSSLQTLRTTGIIIVTSTAANATISISQTNSDAKVLGKGHARIRLAPGSYQLAAGLPGAAATSIVQVSSKRTFKITLQPSAAPVVASVDNVNFSGLSALLQNGLTSSQITNLKQLFFNYKKSVKSVVLDTTSVQMLPHNPNGTDPTFGINFTGTIDGTPFKATVSYVGLTNVRLIITDPQTGAQLYSGNSTPSSPDA